MSVLPPGPKICINRHKHDKTDMVIYPSSPWGDAVWSISTVKLTYQGKHAHAQRVIQNYTGNSMRQFSKDSCSIFIEQRQSWGATTQLIFISVVSHLIIIITGGRRYKLLLCGMLHSPCYAISINHYHSHWVSPSNSQ